MYYSTKQIAQDQKQQQLHPTTKIHRINQQNDISEPNSFVYSHSLNNNYMQQQKTQKKINKRRINQQNAKRQQNQFVYPHNSQQCSKVVENTTRMMRNIKQQPNKQDDSEQSSKMASKMAFQQILVRWRNKNEAQQDFCLKVLKIQHF